MRLTNHEKILISKYEYVFVELKNPISNWKHKTNSKNTKNRDEKVCFTISSLQESS